MFTKSMIGKGEKTQGEMLLSNKVKLVSVEWQQQDRLWIAVCKMMVSVLDWGIY